MKLPLRLATFLPSVLSVALASPAWAVPTAHVNGISIELVTDQVMTPTTLAFIGSNDFLVLEKSTGKVRRVTDDVLNPTEVLDLAVEGCDERGLLGIALHPDFAENQFVYLWYNPSLMEDDTALCGYFEGYVNKVERYTWNGSALVSPSDVLELPSDVPYHNGGIISFGPDGKLYGVIGDNDRDGKLQNNAAGADPDDTGIIFRVNDDGSDPGDNPFDDTPGAEKIFAYGIRNSFGLAWDPENGNLWQSENGPSTYDELNLFASGANSGWRDIMGPDSRDPQGTGDLVDLGASSTYSDPEFSWLTPVAVTGIAFATGNSALGGEFEGDLFAGDFENGDIRRFELNQARTGFVLAGDLADGVLDDGDDEDAIRFAGGFEGVTDLKEGPDGALYVVEIGGNAVYRITGEGSGPLAHDLAISKAKAPSKISLSARKPVVTKELKLTLENRGSSPETIADAPALATLVSVDITSLTGCPALAATPLPPKNGFPIEIAAGKKVNLAYTLSFDCPTDATQGTPDFDYEITVALPDDSDPSNDVCPRAPSFADKGCGAKGGGPLQTDVVFK